MWGKWGRIGPVWGDSGGLGGPVGGLGGDVWSWVLYGLMVRQAHHERELSVWIFKWYGWMEIRGNAGSVSGWLYANTRRRATGTDCGGGWLSSTGLQALGQGFQLVEDFGEGWKLVASKRFISDFLTGSRVIDAVDVFVGVAVEVMVLEQQIAAGNAANVAEPIAA